MCPTRLRGFGAFTAASLSKGWEHRSSAVEWRRDMRGSLCFLASSPTDYSGQVCWSGAKICVVGVQAYHRARSPDASVSARRWKKVLIPLVFALNPFEDSDHYSICFSWAKKLLMMLCFQRGVRAPQPLFHACHGDWTRSLQKNYKERLDARSSIFL